MGMFNWGNNHTAHHTRRTARTTGVKQPSLLSRMFGTGRTPRTRTTRPRATRRTPRAAGTTRTGGMFTTHRRTRRTTHTRTAAPAAVNAIVHPTHAGHGTAGSRAMGTPRRKNTGLFDSFLGRNRHARSTSTHRTPWLHPNHQRAPTPHTGLGDKVLGTVTMDPGKRRTGEKKSIWARNVRQQERGRRGGMFV